MSTGNTPSVSDDFSVLEDLVLPEALRKELSRQHAELIEESALPELARRYTIAAIGDVVCHTFLSAGIIPKIMVFDFKTQRGEIPPQWVDAFMSVQGAQLKVRSPPAVLTKQLWDALVMAWNFPGVTKVQVVGEEDLAGLASIYLMKGAIIVYGLPGKGMTGIVSGPETRGAALSILSKMVPAGGEAKGSRAGKDLNASSM